MEINKPESRWYEGDVVQINRAEYPSYSKFRMGTIEWFECESVGVRLDANDSLEQFPLKDCTLIARGEKYHYEMKIAALTLRAETAEAEVARATEWLNAVVVMCGREINFLRQYDTARDEIHHTHQTFVGLMHQTLFALTGEKNFDVLHQRVLAEIQKAAATLTANAESER